MTHWLRVLVSLPEDPSSVPNTCIEWLKTPVTPVSGNLMPSCGFREQLHVHGTYLHIHT